MMEFYREHYSIIDSIEDMSEIMVDYGYCAMFFFFFPLTPVIALISLLVEIQIDWFKLKEIYRRPIPYVPTFLSSQAK